MESFVPGTLERLGLGPATLHARHPRSRSSSAFPAGDRPGPARARPGFGTLIEAASGFAAMNGEPDGAPIVPGFPLADATSALYAVNAIMFALYHRDVHGGGGQVIDLSLFESLFSLLGPLPAEYAALGSTRSRNGSRSRNAGPRGCYRTKRRRLDRGQRIDAEDGGTFPPRRMASTPCSPIRGSPPTKRASRTAASWTQRSAPRSRRARSPRTSRSSTSTS